MIHCYLLKFFLKETTCIYECIFECVLVCTLESVKKYPYRNYTLFFILDDKWQYSVYTIQVRSSNMTNDKSLSITYVSTSCTITVPDLVTGLQDTVNAMTKRWVLCLGFFTSNGKKGVFLASCAYRTLIKKRKSNFPHIWGNSELSSCTVIIRKGFLIYEERRKYFPMSEEAVSHIWLCNCSVLNFLIFEANLILLFISVCAEKEIVGVGL